MVSTLELARFAGDSFIFFTLFLREQKKPCERSFRSLVQSSSCHRGTQLRCRRGSRADPLPRVCATRNGLTFKGHTVQTTNALLSKDHKPGAFESIYSWIVRGKGVGNKQGGHTLLNTPPMPHSPNKKQNKTNKTFKSPSFPLIPPPHFTTTRQHPPALRCKAPLNNSTHAPASTTRSMHTPSSAPSRRRPSTSTRRRAGTTWLCF